MCGRGVVDKCAMDLKPAEQRSIAELISLAATAVSQLLVLFLSIS